MAEYGAGVGGAYQLTVVDARTGRVKQRTPWYQNMILDQGIDTFISSQSNFYNWGNFQPAAGGPRAHVGTSDAPVDPTQTGLVAPIGPISSTGGATESGGVAPEYEYNEEGHYFARRVTFFFPESKGNGIIREAGIYMTGTGITISGFASRVVLPVPIEKTPEDQMYLTWEQRTYPPALVGDPIVTTIQANLRGVVTPIDCTTTPYGVNNEWHWGFRGPGGSLNTWAPAFNGVYLRDSAVLPGRTENGVQPGTSRLAGTGSWAAYVPGSFFREIEFTLQPATNIEFPIHSLGVRGFSGYSIERSQFVTVLSQPIVKTSDDRFVFGARYSLARVSL